MHLREAEWIDKSRTSSFLFGFLAFYLSHLFHFSPFFQTRLELVQHSTLMPRLTLQFILLFLPHRDLVSL